MRILYYTKAFVIIVMLFGELGTLWSQNNIIISGKITDSNRQPVAQAMVAIESTTRGTYSANDGTFIFRAAPGRYTVVVSAYGYNTVRQEVDLTQPSTMDFVLQNASASIQEVEVAGKSAQTQTREKAFNAASVDIKPMAATVNNLNTVIGRAGGVRIREEGGTGSDFNLSIHGLSGNAVRYFIDGIPMSAMGSAVTLANLPVNLIERIEIFKGVVPAELGEDALGGAINIITRSDKRNSLDASMGYGSFNTLKGDLNAQTVNSKNGFTIRPSLGFSTSDNNYIMRGVEVWNNAAQEYQKVDKRRFHDGYNSRFGKIESGWTGRKWADEALIGITVATSDKEIQTGQKQTVVVGDATRENTSLSLSARYAKRNFIIQKLSARLFMSHTNDHTTLTDTTFRVYSWDGSWVNTSFSEVTGRGKSIRHYKRPQTIGRANMTYAIAKTTTVGINYMLYATGNERYDDFDRQFISTNDQMTRHITGIYLNHNAFNDKVNISFFAKNYTFHTRLKQKDLGSITGIDDINPTATKNFEGYGVAGRYTFSSMLSAKASFEKSIRLPSANEFLGNRQTIYPNFKLKPETGLNLNLGLYGERSTGQKSKIQYESSFFLRKVEDYILRVQMNERQSQYDNIASATINGIEAELAWNYGNKLRISANGSYIDERNKNRFKINGSPDVTYNNRMPNRPWLFANAEAEWNIHNPLGIKESRLQLSYLVRYTQYFYLTWEAHGNKNTKSIIPSQYAHSAAATWHFKSNRYALSTECSNLLNHKLYDNYMLQKPGRAYFIKFRLFIQ